MTNVNAASCFTAVTPEQVTRLCISGVMRYDRKRSHRLFNGNARVYVSPKSESVLENFVNRTTRPVATYRVAATAALAVLGITGAKLRWSKHAGCGMCPCSPGFIVDAVYGFDVYVTVEYAPVLPAPANRIAAVERLVAEAQS